MTIKYDSSGIISQNLIEILEEREENLRPILGNDFQIDKTSPIGNMELADANSELAIQELITWLFPNQMDANTAEGVFLDAICEKNRIYRYKPKQTKIHYQINGTPNKSFSIGDIIVKDNISGILYDLNEDCNIGSDGKVLAEFICEEMGEQYPLENSELDIQTPLEGLTSVTLDIENANIVLGRETETDEELRRRRSFSVEKTSTNTLASIKAVLYSTDGVKHVRYFENDTEDTDDNGLPMKSFEFIVDGGDEDEITDVIFTNKTAGTRAFGTTLKTKKDSEGNVYSIGYTKANVINIGIKIELEVSEAQSKTWENEIKNALKTKFEDIQDIGTNVKDYNYYQVLTQFDEITDIANVQFFNKDEELPTYYTQYIINNKEIAKLDIDNIQIIYSVA